MLYNSTILVEDNIEYFHTWTNLIQGDYQFSVVGSTSTGPGEAASMKLPIILSKLINS